MTNHFRRSVQFLVRTILVYFSLFFNVNPFFFLISDCRCQYFLLATMADIAKPKRDRKKRSRFTDASPERDGDAKKSGSSEFEGNVSSTESEDSETEAMVKFKKSMQKAQLKQKNLDDDVNKRDWGRGANKKSKRRRRRDSTG